MTIGANIRRIRDTKGISREKLARMTDLSYITIEKYENGQRNPKGSNIVKIATALKVGVNEIIGEPAADAEVIILDKAEIEIGIYPQFNTVIVSALTEAARNQFDLLCSVSGSKWEALEIHKDRAGEVITKLYSCPVEALKFNPN